MASPSCTLHLGLPSFHVLWRGVRSLGWGSFTHSPLPPSKLVSFCLSYRYQLSFASFVYDLPIPCFTLRSLVVWCQIARLAFFVLQKMESKFCFIIVSKGTSFVWYLIAIPTLTLGKNMFQVGDPEGNFPLFYFVHISVNSVNIASVTAPLGLDIVLVFQAFPLRTGGRSKAFNFTLFLGILTYFMWVFDPHFMLEGWIIKLIIAYFIT